MCEVSHGSLSLLFSDGNLGVNIDHAAGDLADALNKWEPDPSTTRSDLLWISFLAMASVKAQYEPCHYATKARIENASSVPDLMICPCLQDNFATLHAYKPENDDFPRDWQKHLGRELSQYFEGLATTVAFSKMEYCTCRPLHSIGWLILETRRGA